MLAIKTEIEKEFNYLRPSSDWAFVGAGRSETNYITHGYHRYPAKFIPNIVRKLITEYTNTNDIVIDPFGGCGTTLVEAKVMGRRSYGFDINPIAKLITQTKITPIKPNTLEKSADRFLASYELSTFHPPTIYIDRLNYWFDEVTLVELNRIYQAIKAIKNYRVRRFYLCTFSHILKNCSRWLMKSTKPQVDPSKILPIPLDIFLRHLRFMTKRNNQFYAALQENGTLEVETKMRIANSMKKLPLVSNFVDLIITSPPYVTSYEYADLHQLSLLWFGNDGDSFKKWGRHTQDFDNFRKKFIGTSLRKNQRSQTLNSNIGEEIIARLQEKDRGVALNVAYYFADMHSSLCEMFRVLKPGAKACIILGNTALQGIPIKNAEVAAEQMQHIGFHPIELIKREVPNKMITPWRDVNSGRFTALKNPNKVRAYQYEYILIMKKN